MKKTILVILLIFGLIVTMIPALFAAETPVIKEQNDTSAKTEVTLDSPGILPTNPFYFLKEFKRGLTRAFTFNLLSKVRYEMGVANEKMAELKLIEVINPANKEAILTSLYNYNDNLIRLSTSVKTIKDVQNNSDVDQIFRNLLVEMTRHNSTLVDLSANHEDLNAVFDYSLSLIAEVVSNIAQKNSLRAK